MDEKASRGDYAQARADFEARVFSAFVKLAVSAGWTKEEFVKFAGVAWDEIAD